MSTPSDPQSVPQPRPSGEGSHGPLPFFEYHLKILSESYISFFYERIRVEEQYIQSLLQLHDRAKAIDAHIDERTMEPGSVRYSWREVRDNIEREAETRNAFLNTIRTDIIGPLHALKETQERTRKRIREDLKDSSLAHVDYLENSLPRLKRAYHRKCQDAEEYKAAQPQVVSPTPLPPGAPFSGPAPPPKTPLSPTPSRPSTTAPRQPSSAVPNQPRTRSPSTSTSLSDLAHQGKKQLGQFITFLGDNKPGGNNRDGFTGRTEGAMRSVRAKREAEEADKEYRKGVHWLDTLRIRRIKILEAGYTSLELFVQESAETVKKVLESYVDNLTATYSTNLQLVNHGRDAVHRISPQKDTAMIHALIPRSLAAASPPRTLYHNYSVGPCKDLIFGISLVDYANARGLGEGQVPKLVRICVDYIQERGLECEGIYRISGRHAGVQELSHRIEKDERAFELNPQTDDVYIVSSLLKLYLRELPDPVFKFPLQERLQHTENREEHIANRFRLLRGKIRRLPSVNQATLKTIVEHLAIVASKSSQNKMDPKNLAIVFGAVIFGEDEMPKGTDVLAIQSWKDSVMEDLITYSQHLFDDRTANSSPPLPPAPLGEPAVQYDYGSSYTKVATLPPRQSADFAPQMPPRPGNSIHPSRRGNQNNLQHKKTPSSSSASVSDEGIPSTIPTPKTLSVKVPDEDATPTGPKESSPTTPNTPNTYLTPPTQSPRSPSVTSGGDHDGDQGGDQDETTRNVL